MRSRTNLSQRRPTSSCWWVYKEQGRRRRVQKYSLVEYSNCAACIVLSASRIQILSCLRRHVPCRRLRSVETKCHQSSNTILRFIHGNRSCGHSSPRCRPLQERKIQCDYRRSLRTTSPGGGAV